MHDKAEIYTDGWKKNQSLDNIGYKHKIIVEKKGKKDIMLLHVYLVII
ncbi:hypothetical protein TREAZ_0320 [Leadbettera azotonutricia ZAS-9]|uniref:Uncharacterized protein n=1 Tax=Leadbettera azotonutricia (strain ATCC BAA-888 / DSM 13862 / ZAS-9) TaxID=545695 RepID=F5YDK2_LEAAZ|nr:hypothetical protein TREAZ_0320 [Leadbettera azotonutricia ZAS-9]